MTFSLCDFFIFACRNWDQLPTETGADHRGHAAVHLHAGGVEVASVCREYLQRWMDEALVGDEVSTVRDEASVSDAILLPHFVKKQKQNHMQIVENIADF